MSAPVVKYTFVGGEIKRLVNPITANVFPDLFRDTWAEAHAALKARAKQEVADAERALHDAIARKAAVAAMREPESGA